MKRLYKDKRNAKIGGVCAGLAEYFNIDVTLIRIVWGVLGLAYGTGLLLYLVCWFVLPEKSEDEYF